ncbi:hypothetical protein [Paraburkholderia sp. SIMBA_054]|uniref:hypothetical protein n=1 Tax=Paraburkholderia sp. SIMBA_054 TaxID=3085795 RepID=UPI00397AB013
MALNSEKKMTDVSNFIAVTALLPSVTLDRVARQLSLTLHAHAHPDADAVEAYLLSDAPLADIDERSLVFLSTERRPLGGHDQSSAAAAYLQQVHKWVSELVSKHFPAVRLPAAVGRH